MKLWYRQRLESSSSWAFQLDFGFTTGYSGRVPEYCWTNSLTLKASCPTWVFRSWIIASSDGLLCCVDVVHQTLEVCRIIVDQQALGWLLIVEY